MLKNFFYTWILGMNATNYERIIVAVVALAGITVLGIMKIVDSNSIVVLYSTIVGFMLGHKSGSESERIRQKNGIVT